METKACWEAAHPNLARESTHHTLMYSDKVYRFGSVMNFVYLVWPMRVLDTVTH